MEETEGLSKVIQGALFRASEQMREFVTPEQVLLESLGDSDVAGLFSSLGCDVEGIASALESYIAENVPVLENAAESEDALSPEPSVALREAYARAAAQAAMSERKEFDIFDLILAIFMDARLHASHILMKSGVEKLGLLDAISSCRRIERGGVDEFGEESGALLGEDEFGGQGFLERFTENMTRAAARGEYDALVGRDEEIGRTIEILLRLSKNNPVHVGDAGVGKTAIARGLCERIARGDVPSRLRGCEVYALKIGDVLSGAKFRGDFEQRMGKIVQALVEKKNAILYIDEIHLIVGTGAEGGNMDAASVLKPVLTSGKLRVMGATTYEEYAKSIEKSGALSRRFQKVDVAEPSEEEAVRILLSLSEKYGAFHGVSFTRKNAEDAVRLSAQHLAERRLPDKAIDVMDEAGVRASLRSERARRSAGSARVRTGDIKAVVAKMAGVPIEDVTESEKSRLLSLEATLKEEIFGQDEAVSKLSLAVKKARAGFRNLDKPEVSFLFVGPTGVGKTELARSLSRTLGEPLLRFDMSEYQESYTVSKLIGSAPGYVGYENGGQLTEQVRKNPHSIVLFDEIEKAHEDIFNVLLQILDYGTLTDNQGKKADFRNCIIILTSNAGARDMERGIVGFGTALGDEANGEATLREAVAREFSPEFRNRLDAIVPFAHLGPDVTKSIARKAIGEIGSRLSSKGISLSCSDDVAAFVAKKGYSREFGARNIARTAEELIASPLIDKIIFDSISRVEISLSGEELSIECS